MLFVFREHGVIDDAKIKKNQFQFLHDILVFVELLLLKIIPTDSTH